MLEIVLPLRRDTQIEVECLICGGKGVFPIEPAVPQKSDDFQRGSSCPQCGSAVWKECNEIVRQIRGAFKSTNPAGLKVYLRIACRFDLPPAVEAEPAQAKQ